MTLTEVVIRRPVFAWTLMLGLVAFGLVSLSRIQISAMPDVDFPVVTVYLSLPGASAEVMESQVVDRVEDAILEIEGIRAVTSHSEPSTAHIGVELEVGRNVDVAALEIQNRIAQARALLPKALDPPIVRKSNPEDQPVLWVTVSADHSVPLPDVMAYAKNTLLNPLSAIEGVGDVSLAGYVDPALRVWVDLEKLNAAQLTPVDVVDAIQAGHVAGASGRLENATSEYDVRLLGEASSPEEFAKIVIGDRGSRPNFRPVPLGRFARVEEGTDDIRKLSRHNGERSVALGILKRHGANSLEISRRVHERVDAIQGSLPAGYQVRITMDSTKFVQLSIRELAFTLGLSVVLTSIVCLLFLGSWSSTLNVLLAIPTSIIGTVTVLYFLGFTINAFTLLGLTLAIGVVVDDSIMMLENIIRYRRMGFGRRQAALRGAGEITGAAVASTLAVVAVFLPVALMNGLVGRYLYQFGVTVTVAILLSLLEALTLTPMRCSRYLDGGREPGAATGRRAAFFARAAGMSVRMYRWLLERALRFRWAVMLGSVVLFAVSLDMARRLPVEMLPAQDRSELSFRLMTPMGTSLETTDAQFRAAERYLSGHPEVSEVFSSVGGGGGDVVNQGSISVRLVDPSERKASQSELIAHFRKRLQGMLKGTQVIAQDPSRRAFSTGSGFPIEFVIKGPDWDTVSKLAIDAMTKLSRSGFLTDVFTDVMPGSPEVRVVPDRDKLAARGVSVGDLAKTLSTLVGGQKLDEDSEYTKDSHRYPIEIRAIPAQRERAEQLKRIDVRNRWGELVPVSDLVELQPDLGPQSISRLNRVRAGRISANMAPGISQKEAMERTERLVRAMLPPGYQFEATGGSRGLTESLRSFELALLLGVLIAYMVLATQFNSLIHPLSILVILPLSFSGAFLALRACHQSLNLYSAIGLVLLMGIAKKNSILLVEMTNRFRKRSHRSSRAASSGARAEEVRQALLEACPVRLRPILMTSVATVAGSIPAALSLGPGTETGVPMSIAIIGGVTISTALSLIVVPCVYSLLSGLEMDSRSVDAEVERALSWAESHAGA